MFHERVGGYIWIAHSPMRVILSNIHYVMEINQAFPIFSACNIGLGTRLGSSAIFSNSTLIIARCALSVCLFPVGWRSHLRSYLLRRKAQLHLVERQVEDMDGALHKIQRELLPRLGLCLQLLITLKGMRACIIIICPT